jgi:hypothetical protein
MSDLRLRGRMMASAEYGIWCGRDDSSCRIVKMEITVSKNKRLSLAEVVGRHDWRILEREF